MNGELVCCWTSQLCATASIQLPTLLTRAPIQIQRKARWRRTSNMERRLIAEDAGRRGASQRAFLGVGERDARDPARHPHLALVLRPARDRKSARLNSSHSQISYAVFCLKK